MIVEKLTIGKKEYDVKLVDMNQVDLKFYPENPRVYSALNITGEAPSQEEIEEHMKCLESVKQLKTSIESNGGLIDPLIVRDGDNVVLEGNSRLAAYRILCEKDPIGWGKVKCKLLPSDIDESAIFTLLGQYHIIGRKDWSPFEQASYLFRRQRETRLPIEHMAKELGITKSKAEKMIEVITFMNDNNDFEKSHYSYYEEYLKSPSIKKYRETNVDIDETIVNEIKKSNIQAAADIRKLSDIAKIGDKQSKKIMKKIVECEIDLYDGYQEMKESGKMDDAIKKMKKFRDYLISEEVEKQIKSSGYESIDNAKFEINKIIKLLEKLKKSL